MERNPQRKNLYALETRLGKGIPSVSNECKKDRRAEIEFNKSNQKWLVASFEKQLLSWTWGFLG